MNVGILSQFGFGRGQCYVTKYLIDALKGNHKVFLLKQGLNKIEEDFKKTAEGISIQDHSEYLVQLPIFENWIKNNKLDIVIFNEYNQWIKQDTDLVLYCKNEKVKTVGYLVWEKFEKTELDSYNTYDIVITPTECEYLFFKANGVKNVKWYHFGIDLDEFKVVEAMGDIALIEYKKTPKNKKTVFFHPGGFGGVHERKNTKKVVKAYEQIKDDTTELIISNQKHKNLPRQELVDLYNKSDVVVLPSKWETIGIPSIEALAAGCAVVCTKMEPFTEFIKHAYNGLLVNVDRTVQYPDIGIEGNEVSIRALAINMQICKIPEFLNPMKKCAKTSAKQFDWKINKKYIQQIIEELK